MPLPMAIPRTGGRRFNPHFVPVARRVPPFAVVHHVGRRSGRRFRTPVVAVARPRDGGGGGVDVVVALPYGPGVDWVRNGQAAAALVLERRSHAYHLDDLRVLHGDDALAVLPVAVRAVLVPLGTRDVLLARVRPLRHADDLPASARPSA